jgi:predicted nucleic-acid-binding Zn-ribbon protein
MKPFIFFIGIIFLLATAPSCDKDDYDTTEDLPGWLQKKISEIISPDSQLCGMTDVTVIRFNKKTYYHIYCLIWSCMYCHLYDENGNRPEWDEKTWNDFGAHQVTIQVLPACNK